MNITAFALIVDALTDKTMEWTAGCEHGELYYACFACGTARSIEDQEAESVAREARRVAIEK